MSKVRETPAQYRARKGLHKETAEEYRARHATKDDSKKRRETEFERQHRADFRKIEQAHAEKMREIEIKRRQREAQSSLRPSRMSVQPIARSSARRRHLSRSAGSSFINPAVASAVSHPTHDSYARDPGSYTHTQMGGMTSIHRTSGPVSWPRGNVCLGGVFPGECA